MSKREEGGQAFPSHPILYSSADAYQAQGMSLRDWFAGQVLAGRLIGEFDDSDERIARSAYELADAMLAERERGGDA